MEHQHIAVLYSKTSHSCSLKTVLGFNNVLINLCRFSFIKQSED